MAARSTTDMIRHLVFTAHKVRHASTTTLPRPKKAKPEHGQQIFVYNHLQTNQVVYSLTKTMKNNAALRQLPFTTKKSKPPALRKDLWAPLATISFPPGHGSLGLSAFQKLRELRKLHELRWDPEDMTEVVEYNDGRASEVRALGRKGRGRKIMDQKANSVADMAAVLATIGGEGGEGLEGMVVGKRVERAEDGKVVVEVRWRDLCDAEYAETWEGNVIHDVLEGGSVESTYGEAVAAEAARAQAEEKKRVAALDKEGKKPEVQTTL